MKYRYYSTLSDEDIPGVLAGDGATNIKGKILIPAEDDVGHCMYETRLTPGHTLLCKSPDPARQNHLYVCLHGNATATLTSGRQYQMDPGSILALPPAIQTELTAGDSAMVRIVVIHCASCSQDPTLPNPIHRDLTAIVGSERDVDWTRGRSRRYLVKDDGFNVSLHNTTCDPKQSSPLCYKQNHESAYFLRGEVEYEWDNGKCKTSFKQKDPGDGEGLLMLMNNNDAHVVHTGERQCECLCVFYPALKGQESHDFTKKGFSVF